MKTIHKYVLPQQESDSVIVKMPLGSIPLHAAFQNNALCVWALVDTKCSMHPHIFYIRGTGQDCSALSPLAKHLTTLQIRIESGVIGGRIQEVVIHLFFDGPTDIEIPETLYT